MWYNSRSTEKHEKIRSVEVALENNVLGMHILNERSFLATCLDSHAATRDSLGIFDSDIAPQSCENSPHTRENLPYVLRHSSHDRVDRGALRHHCLCHQMARTRRNWRDTLATRSLTRSPTRAPTSSDRASVRPRLQYVQKVLM